MTIKPTPTPKPKQLGNRWFGLKKKAHSLHSLFPDGVKIAVYLSDGKKNLWCYESEKDWLLSLPEDIVGQPFIYLY
jgi:hypothetical protein